MSSTTASRRDVRPAEGDGRDSAPAGIGRLVRWVGLISVAVTGALLSVGAFLGLYVRPTSDDWCAVWKTRDMGVFGIASDFYMTQNGRVTNALLSGVVYADGLLGPKVLPLLLILTLGVGLVLLGREVLRAFGLRAPLISLVAAAMLLETLLFFAGTRSYQVLLWAPATISHTLPSIIGIWAVLTAVWAARSGRRAARAIAVVGVVLLGVAIGTLSEPFTAVAGLFAGTAGLLSLPRLKLAKDWFPFTWCAAACFGLVSGLVLLYTSPGARWRRSQQPPRDTLAPEELKATVRDWVRIWQVLSDQWAYLGAIAAGLLLGLAVAFFSRRVTRTGINDLDGVDAAENAEATGPSRGVLRLVMLLPVPLILVATLAVTYGLRSGYGPSGWTYARTWTSFMVPLLMALCLYGVWLGRLLGARLSRAGGRSSKLSIVAVVVTAAAVLGSAAALLPEMQTLTSGTVTRGIAWDKQDARIRAQVARGATDVEYRPLHIGWLAEPYYTRNYQKDWVAQCVSTYYGVERIHRP